MAGRVVREGCVLLLGKSGAGKSSVANHLLRHDPLSPDAPPFFVNCEVFQSGTREVTHKTVEFMWENDLYRVTVVDTPGLFDTCNPVFDRIVVPYIRENNLRIDLILFVTRKGCLTVEERKIFSLIMAKLRSTPPFVSALVVTGCESDDATTREEFVQEFKVNPVTREIASQMGMGIYPVGFPPLSGLPPVFQQAYIPQMVKDRDMLLDLILQGRERGEQHCF